MTPAEILGVEIKQFVGQDNVKTLVPRVIGQTTTADTTKGVNKGKDSNWTEETFISELTEQQGTIVAEVARKLLFWLKPQMTRIWYGTGRRGSMVPVLNYLNVEHYLFSLWTTGNVEIYFQWNKRKAPFDSEQKILELLKKLNQIKGVNITIDKISARPNFPLSLLIDKMEYQKFIEIYKWFIDEVEKSQKLI
jgi:hypothetical protein